jgi:hypothetical protein
MREYQRLTDYSRTDVPVTLFWSVFDGFSEEQKKKMLWFITGSPLAPALGFQIEPILLKRIVCGAERQGRIPVAHTCFRRLDLPDITDEAVMAKVLQICLDSQVDSGVGGTFELE